ncbi:hypothetical protein GBF38_023152, partial [Nibea albiflora]
AAGDSGVCAIAWQQALPEAVVNSREETDSALKHCAKISLVVEKMRRKRHQWGLCHVGSEDKRDAPVNVGLLSASNPDEKKCKLIISTEDSI